MDAAKLAVADGWVYYVSIGSCGPAIMRVASSGSGAPALVAYTKGSLITALATDATDVYYADNHAGAVLRVPVGGGSPAVLGSGFPGQLNTSALVLDTESVYVTTGATQTGAVVRIAK